MAHPKRKKRRSSPPEPSVQCVWQNAHPSLCVTKPLFLLGAQCRYHFCEAFPDRLLHSCSGFCCPASASGSTCAHTHIHTHITTFCQSLPACFLETFEGKTWLKTSCFEFLVPSPVSQTISFEKCFNLNRTAVSLAKLQADLRFLTDLVSSNSLW